MLLWWHSLLVHTGRRDECGVDRGWLLLKTKTANHSSLQRPNNQWANWDLLISLSLSQNEEPREWKKGTRWHRVTPFKYSVGFLCRSCFDFFSQWVKEPQLKHSTTAKKDLISLQITLMTADKSHLPTGNQSLNTTCFKDALFFLMKYK